MNFFVVHHVKAMVHDDPRPPLNQGDQSSNGLLGNAMMVAMGPLWGHTLWPLASQHLSEQHQNI